MDTNNTTAKPKLADSLGAEVAATAATANAEDRKKVMEIIVRAKTGVYGPAVYDVTPGMAAILFTDHNPHNRDWGPPWTIELGPRRRGREAGEDLVVGTSSAPIVICNQENLTMSYLRCDLFHRDRTQRGHC
jgi:hypothetical protein